MTEKPLTPAQIEALKTLAAKPDGEAVLFVGSGSRLVAAGMAEPGATGGGYGRGKARYRITQAGRDSLQTAA